MVAVTDDMGRRVKLRDVRRNLRKKLAKIDLAKEKVSKGEALTPEQETSVAAEADVRAEMRELGATDV